MPNGSPVTVDDLGNCECVHCLPWEQAKDYPWYVYDDLPEPTQPPEGSILRIKSGWFYLKDGKWQHS